MTDREALLKLIVILRDATFFSEHKDLVLVSGYSRGELNNIAAEISAESETRSPEPKE